MNRCPLCKSPIKELYEKRCRFECGSTFDSSRKKMVAIADSCREREATWLRSLFQASLDELHKAIPCPHKVGYPCQGPCESAGKDGYACWKKILVKGVIWLF